MKDKARFIPVHEIANLIGVDMYRILPALHAFTGCDSTSSFFSTGKEKPFKLAKSNRDLVLALADLGISPDVTNAAEIACAELVCNMYDGKYNGTNVNELRYRLFCRKQARNEDLPPTADSLKLHVQRVNYQCLIWRNALETQPDIPSPIGCGWELDDYHRMQPLLMTIDPALWK